MSDPTNPLYMSLEQLKGLLGIPEDDTSQDARLTAMITVASRAIDIHCRRTFYLRTETHRFDAAQLREAKRMERTAYPYPWGRVNMRLWLDDDLHSVTEVLNGDGSVLDPVNYILYPLIGPPYRWIDMRLDKGIPFRWVNTPQAAFSVSGAWGYITDISAALIPMACELWINQFVTEAQNPGVQSKSIGNFSVSFQQTAAMTTPTGLQEYPPPNEVAQLLNGLKFRDIRTTV